MDDELSIPKNKILPYEIRFQKDDLIARFIFGDGILKVEGNMSLNETAKLFIEHLASAYGSEMNSLKTEVERLQKENEMLKKQIKT